MTAECNLIQVNRNATVRGVFGNWHCRMLLPCSQIHTCAHSALLSLRAGSGKKKACMQAGEEQPAFGNVPQEGFSHSPVRHHNNFQAQPANSQPKCCWSSSPGGAVFVPCCHGTSPLHDQRRSCNCICPRGHARTRDLHASGNPLMAHTARLFLHPGDGVCAGKLPAPKLTNQVKLT